MKSLTCLDSGAHSIYLKFFAKDGIYNRYDKATFAYTDTPEFKKYLEDYIQFLLENKDYLDLYVTLDIIGNPEKTWEIQKYIESFGLNPLPVFHYGEDFKWLEQYVNEYEYIGIGGLGQDISKSKWIPNFGDPCFEMICDTPERTPKIKVHGFAITSPDILIRYPFYSIDSTSWVMYGKYGIILIPKKENGKYRYDKTPICVGVSTRSPKMNIEGVHINSMPPEFKIKVNDYLLEKGFRLGRSDFKKVADDYKTTEFENWADRKKKIVEIILEEGVSNNHKQRDQINLMYFLDLEKSFPEWPWAWKAKRLNRLC
jgi:hypothetical protein